MLGLIIIFVLILIFIGFLIFLCVNKKQVEKEELEFYKKHREQSIKHYEMLELKEKELAMNGEKYPGQLQEILELIIHLMVEISQCNEKIREIEGDNE